LQNAIEPLAKPSKQISKHAHDIAAPFKTREEKIKALRDSVLQHIRLAGPSFTELPLSTLSTPDATLARGYGHALDRMILLNAMLRAEGFSTEIVFAESRKTPDGERLWSLNYFPQRNAYTMPLIEVLPEPPKRSLWDRWFGENNHTTKHGAIIIGDGDQYTPLGATAFHGHDALELASAEIRGVFANSELRPQTKSETVIDLQPNGDAVITHTVLHFGAECAKFRKHYAEQSPEERRREHLELINAFSRGAEPLSELTTETEAYPGVLTFTLRAPRYAVLGENTMTVLLPPPPALPLPLRSDKRLQPMLAPNIFSDNKTVRVILPEGFNKRVVSPKSYNITGWAPFVQEGGVGRGGRMNAWQGRHDARETIVNERKTLELNYYLQMNDVRVEPDMYPLLLEANRKITHPSQRTLILMRE